jgi:PEP-CTERM motif-containing protein
MKPKGISALRLTAVVGSVLATISMGAAAQTAPAPGLSALSPPGPFLVRFDENGNATISVNGGPATTLRSGLAPDPTLPAGAGQQLALTYMLPEPVIAGDVSFAEVAGGPISDWLRFTDAAGHLNGATGEGTRMLFYSDVETGETGPDLADRGFPVNLGTGNFLAQLEVGLEGNNGFDYRPGGVPAPLNNEYIGISDAVPEPETVALMLAGLGALGFVARQRRKS